jgi:hypothetical protein
MEIERHTYTDCLLKMDISMNHRDLGSGASKFSSSDKGGQCLFSQRKDQQIINDSCSLELTIQVSTQHQPNYALSVLYKPLAK